MVCFKTEMPKNCPNCPFSHWDIDDKDKTVSVCNIIEDIVSYDENDKKHEKCPLIQDGSSIKVDIEMPKTCNDCPCIGTDIEDENKIEKGSEVIISVCNILKCKVKDDTQHKNCPIIKE